MALTKYKLGELLQLEDERNGDGRYTLEHVKGISIQKVFIETKADMGGVSLAPYILVKPDSFAYVTVTSRNGGKITIAHNSTQEVYIVSSSYVVFRVKRRDLLNSDYLFMYFNRSEFDRYARTNSWGSARETFSWEDMCDIDIELPDLPTQQKYADVYLSMLANQQSYECGLEDLKLVCDGYVEELRRKMPHKKIGPYIIRTDVRNHDHTSQNVMGVSVYKEFRQPTSKVNKDELSNYKVVKPGEIAFVQTTHNEKVFANALNNTEKDILVSSVNEVFYTDRAHLLPEYLRIFFNRTEFDRYARFHSWGTARELFTWDDLCEAAIPIPDIEVQRAISEIYVVYTQRKEINEKLKSQIKDVCPVLIRGSLQDGG